MDDKDLKIQNFHYDIEKDLMNDTKFKEIKTRVDKTITDLRHKLGKGVASEGERRDLEKLLDGYSSFEKIMDRVVASKKAG